MTTEKKYGKKWRLLTHDGGKRVELENQGTFDELVVDDWLHIEQMDESVWWLRVADARLMVTIDSEGRATLDVERGYYAAPRGATRTRE